MPAPRAAVTTEAPAAPILVSLYTDSGLAGRVELSVQNALGLAVDLLNHITAKRNAVMHDVQTRRWECLIDAAREMDGSYAPTPEGVLPGLLVAFEDCSPADLPAYAVGEFLRSLDAQIRAYNDNTPAALL